jgi:lipopolysaccharide/colanic/teichoic acid biosynthesis glycosyltransferase
MDVAVSLIALVALSPLLALCALVIRLDSAGPILFRQERVGERGKRFIMLKFRSMRIDCDQEAHRHYAAAFIRGHTEQRDGADGSLYKLLGDPRITRVGGWMRRASVDELPQLWNVLCGEMSLVGPRPPIPYELEHYRREHLGRLAVKPGITGLWQVSGRSKTTFERMVEIDLEYIRRPSLRGDLQILLRTVPVVLCARDAG